MLATTVVVVEPTFQSAYVFLDLYKQENYMFKHKGCLMIACTHNC